MPCDAAGAPRRRRPAPRRRAAPAATAGTGRSSGGSSTTGAPAVGDEADDVHQPVSVGAQLQVPGSRTAEDGRDLRSLRSRTRGEPGPEFRVAGGYLERLPALRVDDGQQTHVGQFQLPWVDDLDRQQLVAGAEPAQGPLPVAVAEEVGDHDHQPAPSRWTPQRLQGGGEIPTPAATGPRGGD